MKKILLGTVLVMLIACFAFGADVDGKWTSDMMGMTINFTFKADGSTLTGTTGPEGMGPETAISEGKIDGKNISFVVNVDFGGQEMKMTYKGTVEANEIKLDMDMGMGDPMPMTLTKAK